MCRIFGFRSVLNSQVNKSLISAENALVQQSERHPDGWGVAYYVANSPHIIKSVDSAIEDKLFQRVSGIVSSETVVAHLRKATQGDHTTINTHPFQYGRWVFAHNGNICDFAKYRQALMDKVAPKLRSYILGDTDSEVIFYLILTHLERFTPLHENHHELPDIISAVRHAIDEIISIIGDYSREEGHEETGNYLTFVLTNGQAMLGFHGGKDIHYSTHKKHCSERDACPFYNNSCENPVSKGKVNHLIFSSEPLRGENIWNLMKAGDLIAIDWQMKIKFSHLVNPQS